MHIGRQPNVYAVIYECPYASFFLWGVRPWGKPAIKVLVLLPLLLTGYGECPAELSKVFKPMGDPAWAGALTLKWDGLGRK